MKLACNLFVEEKGKELIEKNLLRNYFNHLHSLFDYELISPKTTAENYSKLLVSNGSFLRTESYLLNIRWLLETSG